jgi:hypothetical protein
MTPDGPVPFTAEEEAARDAEEAAWAIEKANPKPAATLTKEQLLDQLQALQSQIQALE